MSNSVRARTLDEAKGLVDGDRDKDYGTPTENFSMIAEAANAFGYSGPGGRKLEAHDVSFLQILTKLGRIVKTPGKADSWVDIAGYAACGNEVSQPLKEEDTPGFPGLPKEAAWRWTPSMREGRGLLDLVLPAGTQTTEEQRLEAINNLAKAKKFVTITPDASTFVQDNGSIVWRWEISTEGGWRK